MKCLGLIAHETDNVKDIVDWAGYNMFNLKNLEIYTTANIASKLRKMDKLKVFDSLDHTLKDTAGNPVYTFEMHFSNSDEGVDQSLGTLIIDGFLDGLVYFWNPHNNSSHQDDMKAVLRQLNIYNIPGACTRNTANHLITSSYYTGEEYEKENNTKVNIALVAHPAKKDILSEWASKYKNELRRHNLFATGTTGKKLEDEIGLEIYKMKSGPEGGDMQL